LEALVEWLKEQGVKSAAMESTGVYWIPLYETLEKAGIGALLVNARQLHKVPGRKTDVSDCQWIQLLHSCGLLRGSFRPAQVICELRALMRQCAALVEERVKAVQWMQKALDQMNVQVHHAVSDLTGKTGMDIVRAIVEGERDPAKLAKLRDRRCRKSEAQIAEHLKGTWSAEHLFNLGEALALYDHMEASIARYAQRLQEMIRPLVPAEREAQEPPEHPELSKAKAMERKGEQPLRQALWQMAGVDLTRIGSIGVGGAQVILTEVGFELHAFPSEKDFVSWLRLCPRTPISGDKPLKKRLRAMGANRVAAALRMAALSLKHSKSALGAEFRRIARRKNGATAVFALARKLAILVYRLLRYGHDYVDIGEQAYQKRFEAKRLYALNQTAKEFGYRLVKTSPAAT
jgi:transposase